MGKTGRGNGEREIERGATGRGRWGGGNGKEETGKGAKGRGMDMVKCLGGHMECLGGTRLQSFLTLPVQRRVPQLV